MTKKDESKPTRRLRDLPPEVRHEIAKQQAVIATEKVKRTDAARKIADARTNINRLKGE